MYQPKLVSEVEGNPCHATCDVQWQAFLTAVRQAMPLMSFAHKHDTGAWVYRSDRPYCCGWIEYTGDRYTVQSRHLSNNRYLGGDEYYYTKSSKRLDIAVRNAKKYITPYLSLIHI